MGTAVGKGVPDSPQKSSLEKRRAGGLEGRPSRWAKRKDTVSKHVGALTDPGIATLAEVLDPAALSKHLRGVSLGSWDGEAVEGIQTRPLRHHEHLRCTLEIGLRTDHGWHFLIGKGYPRDRFEVFQAMEKIQPARFGPPEEV